MAEIIQVKTNEQILVVEQLGQEIWHHHYTPIIGVEQVLYMLDKFQSEKAIESQIEQGFEYYLIYENNDPCGYFAIEKREAELFLSKLYVHHKKRGMGLGGYGLSFIENRGIELNCNRLGLTVNKHNLLAIKTYEKKGFIKEKELVMDIGAGFVMDDFKMIKKIAS